RLAAQQDAGDGEQRPVHLLLDLAFRHQVEELLLVILPAPFRLLVGIEHLPRRGQQRLVHVVGVAHLAQEERQVVALGEAGKLRHVVQSHVDESSNAVSSEDAEELGGVFLGETDRKDFHGESSGTSNRDPCTNGAASGSSAPSPRMCVTATPRRAMTRLTRSWRWQTAGFSSLHMMATRYFLTPCSRRSMPARNSGDSASRQ